MCDFDQIEVDDIFENKPSSKKKINGKKKGNRVELELCKKLTDYFGETFSRSVGSGNRWGQVQNMPVHAKQTLTGDICVPEDFKWVIEVKGGYDNDVDFSSVMEDGCSRINSFIEQSSHDAEISNRLPIILWKRSRKPWIAILRKKDCKLNFNFFMIYQKWIIVSLDQLFKKTNKDFWFHEDS